ncbi:hypothetical protein PRIPAC_91958 [Pristionchus pacificus]|uniref:Uncharacterized protein n=1 Tax=Pristionchus pacificus TaxID=54126 RepID=A0A2A6BQI9_PRIPA|nr:hypothetical protein PRIPAC_91958 [Pristionchus pacificus]|eukprot:PDM68184.1 hypothetical protein PRIPAC_46228 [Pristionchus pacificus]
MRLWLSLVTVLVLLPCIDGDHIPLEDCAETSVCLIFGNDPSCTVNGVQTKAYVWQKDKSKTRCQNENYGYVYARLDIQPYTPSKWKFLATFYEKYNVEIGQKLESLYTAQTDFEGLKTEILEETTATAKLGDEPVQDAGTPLGTARPSLVPSPVPTAGTPSVIAVATAEFSPAV